MCMEQNLAAPALRSVLTIGVMIQRKALLPRAHPALSSLCVIQAVTTTDAVCGVCYMHALP